MIIDRFEGNYAVCEISPDHFVLVGRAAIPPESHEGDVLLFRDGALWVDAQQTAARRARVEGKLNRLFAKSRPIS